MHHIQYSTPINVLLSTIENQLRYILPLSEPWPAPARLLCTIHNKVAEVFVADL